ncbi:hypothetical protein KAT92_05910, partial [Candidatus Babeliales bacterium]|nr:hypothetical protein [Candidatus Babeliales bacterium]
MRKKTQEDVLASFKAVHGDKYDYSDVNYNLNNEKVKITCPEHGIFWQKPAKHKAGSGCTECGRLTTAEKTTHHIEKVIKDFKEIHKCRYNYSKVEYINSHTKVIIICNKHGEFLQKPYDHKTGT